MRHRWARVSLLIALATAARIVAADTPKGGTEKGSLPLPPMRNGGIVDLWEHDHEYIKGQFGQFELLNRDNVSFRMKTEGVADTTWKLAAIGNFLPGSIQYATLARRKGRDDGVLLLMFRWVSPDDSSSPHGVFYDAVIGKDALLIRTKQGIETPVDTLELSCSDTERLCAKCFFDSTSHQMILRMVDKD